MSKRHRIKPKMTKVSRKLRRQQTPMERRLWSCLRRNQLAGLRFRRQHPIGSYVVDFYCTEYRLIIEVDGASHKDETQYDQERSTWLCSESYQIIRVSNNDVRRNLEGVLVHIQNVIREEKF